MTEIYVMRHAQSEANLINSPATGDHVLTPLGKSQALSRSHEFSKIPIQAIYTSLFKRAVETAEIIGAKLSVPVHIVQDLRERSFGSFDCGEGFWKLRAVFDHLTDEERLHTRFVLDMETNYEARERVMSSLHELAQKHPNQTIVAISHSALMIILLSELGHAPFSVLHPSGIKNMGYAKLQVEGKTIFVAGTKGIAK